MTDQRLPDSLRLLHLGDSYTCSEGMDPDLGWPALVAGTMRACGHDVAEQRIIARTGWTTGELLQAICEGDPGTGWDLVTLCIGVNNQYRGLPVESFGEELKELIDRARDAASGRWPGVHLLTIPDWGVAPFARNRDRQAIAGRIDAFTELIWAAGRKYVLPVHDLTTLSRRFGDRDDAFAPDGLHPSASQHQSWAEYLAGRILGHQKETSH